MKNIENLLHNYIVYKHMENNEYVDISVYDQIPCETQPKDLISSEVETGGTRVLYDGSAERFDKEDSSTNEIRLLHSIVKDLIPEINFIDMQKIYNLVKSDSYTNYDDYHGNTYDYQINYIPIKDFIDCVKELNLFDVVCENIAKIEKVKNKVKKQNRP